jgi:hypothetical protein
MQKHRVFQLSQVSFQLDDSPEQTGTFCLYSISDDLRFEWLPSHPEQFASYDLPAEQCRLVLRLSDISEIVRTNDSLHIVSLQFVLGADRLPPFRSRSYPRALVTHLLEFLVFRRHIQAHSASAGRFLVVARGHQAPRDPRPFVTPQQLLFLAMHKRVMHSVLSTDLSEMDETLSLQDCMTFFDGDGRCSHFVNLKREVFRRGLKDDARCLMWPLLLGVRSPSITNAENDQLFGEKVAQYQLIKSQWEALTQAQKMEVGELVDLVRVIENDVKRTDRLLPQFRSDDSQNLSLLNNVLICYALFNTDTRYVQGMGDLVSPFIVLLIKGWRDGEHAIMFNGAIARRDEAEALLFWMLNGILATTEQDRMFTNLRAH